MVEKPDDAPEPYDMAAPGTGSEHTGIDWEGLLWAVLVGLAVFSPLLLSTLGTI